VFCEDASSLNQIAYGSFITIHNPPCPLVPQAASPCPSAIGCASGECRVAWLAGVLTWQAGQTVSSIKFNYTRSSFAIDLFQQTKLAHLFYHILCYFFLDIQNTLFYVGFKTNLGVIKAGSS